MRKIKMLQFKQLELLCIRLIIKVLIVFFIAQFLIIYLGWSGYIGFVFCPLIYVFTKKQDYFFEKKRNFSKVLKHAGIYLLLVVASVFYSGSLSLWLLLAYFITYSILMNRYLNNQRVVLTVPISQFLIRLFWQLTILAIFNTLLQLLEYYFGNIGHISTRLIWLLMLVVNLLFSLVILISLKNMTQQVELQNVDNVLISDLSHRIIDFFETSDRFLNPQFSISCLAKCLGEQKVLVSQAINRELNMTFYLLVAKHRINYAKAMLLSDEACSINVIVKHCGFHSRSTFYKYFQMFVGVKPHQYRSENKFVFVKSNNS